MLMLALLLPASANAMAITNLSGVPQTVEIRRSAEFEPIVIAPDATLRLMGRYEVRMNDHVKTINEDEEFAIWKDGLLQPQRRIDRTSKKGL